MIDDARDLDEIEGAVPVEAKPADRPRVHRRAIIARAADSGEPELLDFGPGGHGLRALKSSDQRTSVCAEMTVDDEALTRAARVIDDARVMPHRRARPDLQLPDALSELREWLADDHQSANSNPRDWSSLLQEVLAELDACGAEVKAAVDATSPDVIRELKASLGLIKNTKGGLPDPSLRHRMASAAERLSERLGSSSALTAALEDVLAAADDADAADAATRLVALASHQGHDPHWFPQRLSSALSPDDVHDPGTREAERSADPSSERYARGIALLEESPRRRDIIVWLRFIHADLRWPPYLQIGDSVTLFESRWLESVLRGAREKIREHAPELAADDEGPAFPPGLRGDAEDQSCEREKMPFVHLRVVVESATTLEAELTARRTGEVLAGLAGLYGTPPRLWELEDSFEMFVGTRRIATTSAALPHIRLTVNDDVALRNDHTARLLADQADRLAKHLPVVDPAMVKAGTLLRWMRQSRLTDAPPGLLLADRVVEQVAGWAGYSKPYRFISEYLRLAWIHDRIYAVVRNAAYHAAVELRRLGGQNAKLADEFADEDAAFGGAVNLRLFLERLDAVRDSTQVRPLATVERLYREGGTSPLASGWINLLDARFVRLERRRRRTRNTLVHGGPLVAATVESVTVFGDSLAVLALGGSIEGRLDDVDLIDHFLTQCSDLETFTQRVHNGDALHEAMFWSG